MVKVEDGGEVAVEKAHGRNNDSLENSNFNMQISNFSKR